MSRRGGGRYPGGGSDALTLSAAENLVLASYYAARVGLPLNRFTTIHWEKARVASKAAATARFLKLMGDWIRSRGGRFAYTWVRENGPTQGDHVHILLHLPPSLASGLKRRQRGWLKACGAAWKAGVIYSRPIGLSLTCCNGDPSLVETYVVNLRETLDYVLKGSSPPARDSLGVRRYAPGGFVVGKRCGVSRNIGRAARA